MGETIKQGDAIQWDKCHDWWNLECWVGVKEGFLEEVMSVLRIDL